MAFISVRSRRGSYASRSKQPTSWPLTPSNSQDSAESAADPHSTSPCNSTDGLIPIANDARLSTQSSVLPARTRRTSSGLASVLPSEADISPSYGLRPARRLPPPLSLPSTPPPSPPRDFACSTTVSSSNLMSSAIVDDREEEKCPICLELLSLRLAGEKPHVVPVCGHGLHHSCFEAVYGDAARAKARTSGSLGLCGVCRRDMKVGDGQEGPSKKTNKFAKLTGLSFGPGPRDSDTGSFKLRSRTRGTLETDVENALQVDLKDPSEDDDLVTIDAGLTAALASPPSIRSSSSTGATVAAGSYHREIVRPVIAVRSEQSSVERSLEAGKKQHLTCMVSIEVPSRSAPPPAALELLSQTTSPRIPDLNYFATPGATTLASSSSSHSAPRSASPTPSSAYSAFRTTNLVPSTQSTPPLPEKVVDDLRERMADWKGHSLNEFGSLRLYDCLHVRKESATREFIVYLFDEAILCVAEDNRAAPPDVSVQTSSGSTRSNSKLRLKGRVYLRHVRSVSETSTDGELSLTIRMTDAAVAEFVMVFQARVTLEVWRSQIEALLHPPVERPLRESMYPQTPASAYPPSRTRRDVLSGVSTSDRSHTTSSSSGLTHTTASTSLAPSSSTIPEEPACEDDFGVFIRQQALLSHSLQPSTPKVEASPAERTRAFTPTDLVVVVSIPPAGAGTLKADIIRSALTCLVEHGGPFTRLALIGYTAGDGVRGSLRKTPFIAIGKAEGRKRLEAAIHELVGNVDEPSACIVHKEDRVNVVTACNLALDIVMQRKAKAPMTGMVLVNDGRDGAGKQQMDLIMARAEAASVPIHTIGYGRSHDPSSLWLLSNHTSGSYTFVKDFYDLRDALMGCVGGILSVAVTNLRLHISVPESRWFRIRKVSGTPGAVIAHTGVDVDVEVGEMRFGERKDLIVEVEMHFDGYEPRRSAAALPLSVGHGREFSSATETFFLTQAGVDLSALDADGPGNLLADEYDAMPDELPLFQVNAAYRDPAAGKSISRLTQSPTLLTITVAPPSPEHRQSVPSAAPELVRRRVELLVSDMLSRALLFMTRRNDEQALRLLGETKRIIATISASLRGATPSTPSSSLSRSSSQRGGSNAAAAYAQNALLALARDVDAVHETFLSREPFETQGRYLAAQQAVVLRDQRSWTPKTAIEKLFWRSDNSLWLVAKSQQWSSF